MLAYQLLLLAGVEGLIEVGPAPADVLVAGLVPYQLALFVSPAEADVVVTSSPLGLTTGLIPYQLLLFVPPAEVAVVAASPAPVVAEGLFGNPLVMAVFVGGFA